jgi:hypothetical protein
MNGSREGFFLRPHAIASRGPRLRHGEAQRTGDLKFNGQSPHPIGPRVLDTDVPLRSRLRSGPAARRGQGRHTMVAPRRQRKPATGGARSGARAPRRRPTSLRRVVSNGLCPSPIGRRPGFGRLPDQGSASLGQNRKVAKPNRAVGSLRWATVKCPHFII